MTDGVRRDEVRRVTYQDAGRDWVSRVAGPPLPGELRSRLDQVVALTCWPPLSGALSHSRLPGGGALLCATRPGEARVEAVYLPDGVEDLVPIDTWRSPSWSAGDAAAPVRGERLTPETTAEFARRNASRLAPFLADVRQLFASPAGRQIVLVEDDPEAVACWVALACASLPGGHARALTFTTRTDRPHRAPQQILGIGPDVPIDEAVEHRFRVHDGVRGQSSPPATDLWAELAARLWLEGAPPADAPPGAAPFDPAPLAAHLLQVATSAGPDEVEDVWHLDALDDAVLHDLVEVLAAVTGIDGPGQRTLARICRRLAGRPAADPLALAIARRRLSASREEPRLGDLPLSTSARADLHREFGPRMEQDVLHRLDSDPIGGWASEVETLIGRGSIGNVLHEAVADRIAAALHGPPNPEQRDAVTFLNNVTDTSLPHDVVTRLERRTRSQSGRDLVTQLTPLRGDWLRIAVGSDTALPFRLVAATCAPDGPTGVELLKSLIECMPESRVSDAVALETAWWLVWRGSGPDLSEIPEIVQVCPISLIFEARLERFLLPWFVAPDRFDDNLAEFADRLRNVLLTPRQKATRELLLSTRELTRKRMPPGQALVRVLGMWRTAEPNAALADGVFGALAEGLAAAGPAELRKPEVRHLLGAPEADGLAPHYRAAVLADKADLISDLLGDPALAADLFKSWTFVMEDGTDGWRSVCAELLQEIIAHAWREMDDRRRAAVELDFRGAGDWPEKWRNWVGSLAHHTNVSDRSHSGTDQQRGPA